ncbi:MAG: hypothetical protein WDN27_03340 [Candidatus Saccharibacteria bacterium]
MSQNIVVGNTTGGTNVLVQSGTGDLQLQTQGTGTLGIGNNSVAQTVQIGNTTGGTSVSISGGSGGVTVGDSATTGAITLGQGTADNTINIGSNIGIGNTQTINIGSSAAGSTDLTIGSNSGSSSLTLQAGSGDISFTGSDATNYNIGGSTSTGTITVGQSTADNTINIGNAALSASTQTVNIATGATGSGSDVVTIGSLIGTSSTTIQGGTGNVTLATNDSSASVIAKSATNSAVAFQVQNASSIAMFNVDTSSGIITFGTGANTVTFTPGGGLVASGTARHTKTIALTPQYAGAVLDSGSDSACTTANSGTMSTGYDNTNNTTFYDWAPGAALTQCYDLVVRVPIPTDFDGWTSSTPLSISTYSADHTTGTVKIDARDTTNTGEASCNYADATPASDSTWTASGSNCTISGTYTGGGTMTLRIRMSGINGSDVRIGAIQMSYYSKF